MQDEPARLELAYGLWLNIGLADNRKSWAVAKGNSFYKGELSFSDVDGITETPECALAFLNEFNSNLEMQRAMTSRGVHPATVTSLGGPEKRESSMPEGILSEQNNLRLQEYIEDVNRKLSRARDRFSEERATSP